MTIDSVVAKFFAEGVMPRPKCKTSALPRFLLKQKRQLDRWDRVNALPDRDRSYLTKSTKGLMLLNKLNLNPFVEDALIPDGFGRLMFAIDSYEVDYAFNPRTSAHVSFRTDRDRAPRLEKEINASGIFPGIWGDVLGVPYYCRPGSVSGFQFMGRNLRPEVDWPWVKLRKHTSPGLTYHPKLNDAVPSLVVCVGDLDAYLRLQASYYMRKPTKPIPLLSWFDKDGVRTKQDSWMYFYPSKKVFWCAGLDASTLVQACENNGRIYCANIDKTEPNCVRMYLRDKTTEQHMTTWIKNAKPWTEVLEQFVKSNDRAVVESLIRECMMRGIPRDTLLSPLSKEVRTHIGQLIKPQSEVKFLNFYGRVRVTDDHRGWTIEATNMLISNARVHLEQAMYNAADNDVYYHGKILYKDKVLKFCVAKSVIDKEGTLAWAHKELIKAKLGVSVFMPKWNKSAFTLAGRFCDATVVESISKVGWNDDNNEFDFANFKLTKQGVVIDQDKMLLDRKLPTRNLQKPESLLLTDVEPLLEVTETNKTIWGVFAYVALNAFSKMYGYNTKGLTVTPDNSKCVMPVMTALGCNHAKVSAITVDDAVSQETTQGWTIGIGLSDKVQRGVLKQVIDAQSGDRVCVVKTSPAQQALLALDNWHGLNTVADAPVAELIPVIEKLLPNYLHDLMLRRAKLESTKSTPMGRVLDDIEFWLTEKHMSADIIAATRAALIDANESQADSVGNLIAEVIADGYVTIVPEGFGNPANSIIKMGTKLFVPKPIFAGAVDKKTGLVTDLTSISEHLKKKKVLLNEIQLDGIPGWVVKEVWLSKLLQQFRQRKNDLKIVNED